jgi:hypothetical protein
MPNLYCIAVLEYIDRVLNTHNFLHNILQKSLTLHYIEVLVIVNLVFIKYNHCIA